MTMYRIRNVPTVLLVVLLLPPVLAVAYAVTVGTLLVQGILLDRTILPERLDFSEFLQR